MPRKARLNPPERNRSVAHRRIGKGTYRSAGFVAGDTNGMPKTTRLTITVAIVSRMASQHLLTEAPSIQERPFVPHATIAGTIVSSAKAFVQNLSVVIGK